MYVVFSLLVLVLFVGALVDVIMHDQSQIKHLPKLVWVLLVVLMPLVGSVLWFALGREYARPVDRGGFGDPRRWSRSARGPADPQPGNSLPGSSVLGYAGRDDAGLSKTERELAALEREIAASEKEERIRRLEEQLRARREIEGRSE